MRQKEELKKARNFYKCWEGHFEPDFLLFPKVGKTSKIWLKQVRF